MDGEGGKGGRGGKSTPVSAKEEDGERRAEGEGVAEGYIISEDGHGGLGLFAARDIAEGEPILVEEPFFSSPDVLAAEGMPQFSSGWPSCAVHVRRGGGGASGEEDEEGCNHEEEGEEWLMGDERMVAMLQGYIASTDKVKAQIMDLCRGGEEGDALHVIARGVAEACAELKWFKGFDSGADLQSELYDALIRILCNDFDGGTVYVRGSRFNHSCDPNIVHSAPSSSSSSSSSFSSSIRSRTFRACRCIQQGEELTISYLGLITLAPTHIRLNKLSISKCFECSCPRCLSKPPRKPPPLQCELERNIMHLMREGLRNPPSRSSVSILKQATLSGGWVAQFALLARLDAGLGQAEFDEFGGGSTATALRAWLLQLWGWVSDFGLPSLRPEALLWERGLEVADMLAEQKISGGADLVERCMWHVQIYESASVAERAMALLERCRNLEAGG